MNALSRHGEMITRKGTGIVEAERKKVLLKHYSRMKKQRTKSPVKTTTSTIKDRLEDKCVWCGRSKKDGKWRTVDGVVADSIERVDRDVLKACGSKLIHADGRGEYLPKLKINFRSKTHCVVCNSSFSPEKNVLIVDSDKFLPIDCWMAQKGIDPDKYKREAHINCMKKIEKEVSDLVSENTSATSIEFRSNIETSPATPFEFRSSIETLSATPSTSIETSSAAPIEFRSSIDTSSATPSTSIETSSATTIEFRSSIKTSSATPIGFRSNIETSFVSPSTSIETLSATPIEFG